MGKHQWISLGSQPWRHIPGRDERQAELISFLEAQLVYAQKAQDRFAMTTHDQSGWLPLHHALHERATLGAIKLLVKGNPAALQVVDKDGTLPLHIACGYGTVGVVKFLVELFDGCLNLCDEDNNSPLHYACIGVNCDVVKYLLAKQTAAVSERNADDELPIHLLCDCGEDLDIRESPEYVETIWRLLQAHPETVLNW